MHVRKGPTMKCAQCGHEIVGATLITSAPGEPVTHWETVPEVIKAHNSLCGLVYPADRG